MKDDLRFVVFDPELEWVFNIQDPYPDLKFTTHIFFEDGNRTWVATQFGLYYFEIRENRFETYLTKKDSLHAMRDLLIDRNNTLWAISNFPQDVHFTPLEELFRKERMEKSE